MQVFKTYFQIAKRQIKSMMIYLGIFFVLIFVLSSIGNDNTAEYTSQDCKLTIFDNDNTQESRQLVEYLSGIHDIVDVKDDKEAITDNMFYGNIDYVLYIEKGYSESGEVKNIKRPGTFVGLYVDEQIASYQKTFNAYKAAGYTTEEANKLTAESMDNGDIVSMEGDSSKKEMVYYFFIYIPYILVMLLFNSVAPVVQAFNKREVSNRMKISAMDSRSRMAQMLMGSAVLSILILGLLDIVSLIMYKGRPLEGEMIFNMLNGFVFLLVAMGIISIVTSFDLNQNATNMVANIVGLGMSFLGGIFVPMEIFGDALLKVAKFLPTYWYVSAQDELFENGLTQTFWECIGVELLFAVAFVSVAMLLSRKMRVARES